jgi:putative membrane protein
MRRLAEPLKIGYPRPMNDRHTQRAGPEARIAASTEALKDSATLQLESAERRTELAADRTILAAERTYAAWVRTGMAALAFGIGAKALLHDVISEWLASSAASLLILFSGVCFVAAVWREVWPGVPPPTPNIRRIPAAVLLAVNGLLLVVSLAALIGSWTITFHWGFR